MNLNSIPKRQRYLVIVAGAGLALLILDSALVEPLIKLWGNHSDEIARLQKDIAEGKNLIVRGPGLQQHWNEMRSASLSHDQAQAEHDLIQAIDTWSRASSVEMGSIRPVWKRGDTEDYSLMEIRLEATGPLGSLTRFMYEMEHSKLALHVESVELVSKDETGEILTLSLTVTGLRLAPLEGKS